MANSLSTRLTYRIMAVVLIMVAIIGVLVNFTVRKYMLDEANERYLSILLENQQELRRRLSDVYVAVTNNVHDIERDIDDPDKMFGHLERMVKMNPTIVCSSILFEKDYYPQKGRVFIPCARKDKVGQVRKSEIDSTYHSYFYEEWFAEQLKKDEGIWTKAYFENKMFAGDQEQRLLTTYSVPLHDHQGRPVAILGADMSLEDLRDRMMEDIQEMNNNYEAGQKHHSYFFVIDQEGTYIVHPDKERMMTLIDENVGRAMLAHRGTCVMEVDGVKSRLYYRTIKHVGWVMVIVTPEDVILSKARILNIIILSLMLLGLAVIYLLCHRQIKKTTRPLQRFARSAEEVALGNFSSELPEVNDYIEVLQLHDAFANMQTSLSIFVDELQKTTTQNASLERELKIAHDIQMAMLPQTLNVRRSSFPVDLFASLTPARDVGGDLYDYYLRDNRLFFCVGDVSGKGMPAALMMAMIRAMFRGETRRAESAANIVDTINRNLSEEYTAGYFVTMFVGILNVTTGLLDYCNAGHEAPLLMEKKNEDGGKITSTFLPVKPNIPVGALTKWDYEGQQAQLQPGDLLFLYTDGLNEAKNISGEQLGRKRVKEVADNNSNDTAQQLVEKMEEEVKHHAGDAKQSDDITLMAIKWPLHPSDLQTQQNSASKDQLTMRSSMVDMALLEPFIVNAVEQGGIKGREAKRLRLAVEEAVANVIFHGQATKINLQATVEGDMLLLTIDDDGIPFDPTERSVTDLSVPADQRPPGGMGIILMHQMTDGLAYQRINGHNILTIKKKRTL